MEYTEPPEGVWGFSDGEGSRETQPFLSARASPLRLTLRTLLPASLAPAACFLQILPDSKVRGEPKTLPGATSQHQVMMALALCDVGSTPGAE